MGGREVRQRGRPSKTDDRRFRLLALAGFAEGHVSQRQLAASINRRVKRAEQQVSPPTVGSWLHRDFERVAKPTVTITEPHLLELRVVRLFFRIGPADSVALIERLKSEGHVSRIERWGGDVRVAAEVIVREGSDLDDIVTRLDPDEMYDVVSCHDQLASALLAIAGDLARRTIGGA